MARDWFLETHTPTTGLTFAQGQVLYDQRSEFQHIQVLDTPDYGRVLVLDQCIMLTERDEYVYHEMIAHPALLLHGAAQRVLIIGGGDGGSVREVLRHSTVRTIDLVEIDGEVIAASRKFFPALSAGLDDSRVTVHLKDGFEHLDALPGHYDVILVDSIDPVGEAAKLFTAEFFGKIQRSLRPGGVAVFQTESPFFSGTVLNAVIQALRPLFAHVAPYLVHIPTYPSGQWSFTLVSDAVDPLHPPAIDPPVWLDQLRYFNMGLLTGAFLLPNDVKKLL